MFEINEAIDDYHYKSYIVNDIKTGADIILGITGDEKDYERMFAIMGNMKYGETFYTGVFDISYIPEKGE